MKRSRLFLVRWNTSTTVGMAGEPRTMVYRSKRRSERSSKFRAKGVASSAVPVPRSPRTRPDGARKNPLVWLALGVLPLAGGLGFGRFASAQVPATSSSSASAAAAPSGAGRASRKDAPKAKVAYSVLAIGDSLTDPRSHGGRYLSYLAEKCPESRIDNYGKGADMVSQMRRRFFTDAWQKERQYTHLLVFGGVNDLYSDLTAGRTPGKVAQDLTAMYAAAHARGTQVIAITVAPWGGFKRFYNAKRGRDTRTLNNWIVEQLKTGLVDSVVDAYSLLSCGNPEVLCPEYAQDAIHFNKRGHLILGRALHQAAFGDCR